ncbi:hypothetical protein NUU61_005163 [Penicillium alfredii]|uniref:Rab-GAP TBC domain-containing protein n=1 Tax=Penicillium alfredii TaxID=1506179 RepID=A0A9W9K8B1_9EURO|nr:uncharacterized protein NUU61_005163 [Penicillium alfredii]KAJ5095807.1 hypothetical protein NUU61_005163 [Penicillium alfredii]
MRSIDETRKRWETLFLDNDSLSDLRAALRSEGSSLCHDGLRSICWKAFLLFEDFDRQQWLRKLTESRDAYAALRAHFLKYIEHPDDLESTVDPLADDEESPWQTLRNDEALRAEILQDVDRCLQENFFFREPATKSKLTDILFIYSKLNPDVGYRQGMHELLAPILWAVDRDSVQRSPGDLKNSTESKDDDLMLGMLDPAFVEHDSFTLFLCVMQTARIYYEHSKTRSANGQMDVIPIVNRCDYLHKEALMIIDHELAEHLRAADVLPQIFLTRWMRLLFGREFPFDEVLMMWDLLFAHGLRSDLVDFTCVAMLLRIRWQLLNADYSTALSLLLRYPSPQPHAPQTFVHDALYLEQNPTAERGSFLIAKYSGRPLESSKRRSPPARKAYLWEDFQRRSDSSSPAQSPTRNSPKSLETLFQDVSQGIQRRTESWGVAKAVRGAVTEARKNMQTMHYEPSPRPAANKPVPSVLIPETLSKGPSVATLGLETKINRLEERNKALATTLREALNDLHTQLRTVPDLEPDKNDAVKQALARAESAQACLEDASLSLSPVRPAPTTSDRINQPEPEAQLSQEHQHEIVTEKDQQTPANADTARRSTESDTSKPNITSSRARKPESQAEGGRSMPRSNVRPSLADSDFSWMLEGSRNLSHFVSPASEPPEETRHPEQLRGKPNPLFGHGEESPRPDAEHDELALHSLRSVRGPL